MTMHTKAATEEVYEMFNQPLDESEEEVDSDVGGYDTDYTDTRVNQDNYYENQGMNEVVTQANELTINEQNNYESSDNKNSYPHTPARGPLAFSYPAMTPIAEATETLTHHMKQAASVYKEPLIDQEVINPLQPQIQFEILGKLDPSLESYRGFYRHEDMFAKEDIVKKALKRNEAAIVEMIPTGEMFKLERVLGTGGFGSVYLAETELGDRKALKVQRETNPWEFYILRTLKERMSNTDCLNSIVNVSSLHVYSDETWMTLDYCSQGTVLDLVNLVHGMSEGNSGLEECVVIFLAIELLKVVKSIHAAGILHCDIKPDNVMLRLNPVADHEWSKYYSRDGSNSWKEKGIMIIDFGRAADMTVLPANVQFTADWKMDDQDCAEMRQGKNWTYQADYYGVAAVIHLLLFGKFITTTKDTDGEMYKVATPLKRYWQKDLWEEVFGVLLNPEFHGTLPIMSVLTDCTNKMAERLEQICEGGGISLKTSLRNLEQELRSKRRANTN